MEKAKKRSPQLRVGVDSSHSCGMDQCILVSVINENNYLSVCVGWWTLGWDESWEGVPCSGDVYPPLASTPPRGPSLALALAPALALQGGSEVKNVSEMQLESRGPVTCFILCSSCHVASGSARSDWPHKWVFPLWPGNWPPFPRSSYVIWQGSFSHGGMRNLSLCCQLVFVLQGNLSHWAPLLLSHQPYMSSFKYTLRTLSNATTFSDLTFWLFSFHQNI